MTKKRAYTSKTGNQTVTAQAVLKERNRFYGGAPTGKSYYSMHPAGERKDVVHVRKGAAISRTSAATPVTAARPKANR